MKSDDEKIPFPKVTFTIPASLLERIDGAASADKRSRSQWMALQLERILDAEAAASRLEVVQAAEPVPAKKLAAK